MGAAVARSLWEEVSSSVAPYPSGVLAVPEPVARTAFFPGGLGLWLEEDDALQSFPKDFIVAGQDFNTFEAYERARRSGSEVSNSSTWRNIRKVFPQLHVSLRDCFFTNVYMGLRAVGPETGRFAGARDRGFLERCARFFFNRQLDVAQPKIILTLGVEPLRVLAHAVFGFPMPRGISRCDQIYGPFSVKHGEVALVALTHPALHYANVARRRFRSYTGMDAEVMMVQAAKDLMSDRTIRSTRPAPEESG